VGEVQYAILTDSTGPTDEVLLAWTEWGAELNCHGGSASALAALQLLTEAGFIESTPEAWYGFPSSLYEEVQPLYARAETNLQLQLLAGIAAFVDEVSLVRARLMEGAAVSSVAEMVANWTHVGSYAETIFKRHHLAIVGAPNAGKSTTFNALLMRDRALVSEVAGTTRDAVRHPCRMAGLEVELFDTAGVLLQAEGADGDAVKRARRALREADLRLLLLDGSRPLSAEDREVWEACRGLKTVVAVNKTDDAPAWGDEALQAWGALPAPLRFAANTADTLPPLMDELGKGLWGDLQPTGPDRWTGPVTLRQRELCRQCYEALSDNQPHRAIACLNQLEWNETE
jgi:small GTP-binding protein